MPTIKELKQVASSNRRDIFYRLVDHLGFYPAKLLVKTRLTPNQITVIWILGQIVSALFLATGQWHKMVLGLFFFQAFFIIDCTDGIVARYKKIFSLNGIYLDYIGHYIANPTLLVSLTIGVYKIQQNPLYLLAGAIAVFSFLLNKALTLNPQWYGSQEQQEKVAHCLQGSLLVNQKNFLYNIFAFLRLEYIFNFMFWGVLFGYAHYTLLIYALFFFLELCRKLISQFMRLKKADN